MAVSTGSTAHYRNSQSIYSCAFAGSKAPNERCACPEKKTLCCLNVMLYDGLEHLRPGHSLYPK